MGTREPLQSQPSLAPEKRRPMNQDTRLEPARNLAAAGIPSIVWGEDALRFAYDVLTVFSDLQLLVSDDLVHSAVEALKRDTPYERTDDVNPEFLDFETKRNAYPNSVRLHHLQEVDNFVTPQYVIILPQSNFGLDALDTDRLQTLIHPPSPAHSPVLAPRLSAFLDCSVDGIMHRSLTILDEYVEAIVLYYLDTGTDTQDVSASQTILSEVNDQCRKYLALVMDEEDPPAQHQREEYIRCRKAWLSSPNSVLAPIRCTSRSSTPETSEHQSLHSRSSSSSSQTQWYRLRSVHGVPPEGQHTRLEPARRIIAEGIPCVLWGNDAMSFAHNVPTILSDLQLLVPDHLVLSAARVLECNTPYLRMEVAKDEKPTFDTEQNAYPDAVRLVYAQGPARVKFTPEHVLILPQSYFGLDVQDTARFQTLVPPLDSVDAGILVPLFCTFLEALVEGLMRPPCGSLGHRALEGYVKDLISSRLEPDPHGTEEALTPGHRTILSEVNDECHWYLDLLFKGVVSQWDRRAEYVRLRKARLAARGSIPAQIGRAVDVGKQYVSMSVRGQRVALLGPCVVFLVSVIYRSASAWLRRSSMQYSVTNVTTPVA